MRRTWVGGAVFAALAATLAVAQAPVESATKPAPRATDGWKSRHQSLVERAKKGGYDVLFIGDSITQGWEGGGKAVWAERFAKWNPVNLGIGGDRTQHVLWRITVGGELDGIDPKVVVVMIGTNNIASNPPEEIADGVRAIVATFREKRPAAKILLLGVFPRSAKGGKEQPKDATAVPAEGLQAKVKEINNRIAKLDDGKMVKYLDIGPKFLDEKGDLQKAVMPDYLHLSADGYKRWADAIEPVVDEMLKSGK